MAQYWGDRGWDNGRLELERGERGERRFDWDRGRGESGGGRDFSRDWDRMMGPRGGGDWGREYGGDYDRGDWRRGGEYGGRMGEGRDFRGMGGMGGGRYGMGSPFGEDYHRSAGDWGSGRDFRGMGSLDMSWNRDQGYNLGRGSSIDEGMGPRELRGGWGREERGGTFDRMGDRLRDMGRRVMGRGPKGFKRSDDRIYEEICERIARYDLAADNVEVKVKDGEVTLLGTVEDRRDKRLIEDLADDVFGVQQVHNQIRIQRMTGGTMGTTGTGGTTGTPGGTGKMHS